MTGVYPIFFVYSYFKYPITMAVSKLYSFSKICSLPSKNGC